MYDLIGDIHGHADELMQLLHLMGYEKHDDIYSHPKRKVIFAGDFIDRGPKIRQTLEIIRPMVESGSALAILGNHELNALAYHTPDAEVPGQFLRRHTLKNENQHIETLQQLSPARLASALNWFRTLPLWLELDGLRVIHACWDDRSLDQIRQAIGPLQGIADSFLQSGCRPGQDLFTAVETVLKGKEATLPEGTSFRDKHGETRTEVRIRWYLSPERQTYRTYSLNDEIDCDLPVPSSVKSTAAPYPSSAKPIFIGHYAMRTSRPHILAENVACLDFNIAKGGLLTAYRWNGEQKLSDDGFVWVENLNAANRLAGSAEALRRSH